MDPFIGSILPMAFGFAPQGWMSCEGQLLAIQQYTPLYALIGTMYGGNGQTTFGLPDLRGRTIIGQGQGPGLPVYNVGDKGGAASVAINTTQMPMHSHLITVKTNSLDAGVSEPGNNFFGGGGQPIYATSNDGTTMNPQGVAAAAAGNGLPFSIQNPYVAMYYNIAVEGIFPSRN